MAHKGSQLTVPLLTAPIEGHTPAAAIAADSDLEAVYREYPRRVGKQAAFKAIRKALAAIAKRGEAKPATWLTERVRVFAASPAGQAGRFCPHPATWFNAGRFDDDPQEWQRDDRAGKPSKRVGEYEEAIKL